MGNLDSNLRYRCILAAAGGFLCLALIATSQRQNEAACQALVAMREYNQFLETSLSRLRSCASEAERKTMLSEITGPFVNETHLWHARLETARRAGSFTSEASSVDFQAEYVRMKTNLASFRALLKAHDQLPMLNDEKPDLDMGRD